MTRVHGEPPALEPVLAASDLHDLFALVDAVHLPRGVAGYIARLVAASHPAMRRRAGGRPQLRQAWQLAPGRDLHWRRGARAGVAARQTQRRVRRSPPRGRAGDGPSAGARLRGTTRRLGRPARRGRAARGDPGDRTRTAADAGSEVTVAMGGKRRRLQWLCFVLALGCATASARAAGEYRTVEIESLKIEIDSEWAVRTAPGYLPVRFDDHQPRRGARRRDSRSGHAISSEVRGGCRAGASSFGRRCGWREAIGCG